MNPSPLNLHIGIKTTVIQYYYNLTRFLSNFSKIPSQKTADIILQMPMSLVFFVASKGKKVKK